MLLNTPVNKTWSPFASRKTALLAFVSVALFAISAQAQYVMTPIWSISATNTAYTNYINVDGTQRGIAYSPTTNHVYVVSRTGGASVHILNAADGAEIGTLDITGVSGGGGGAINLVDVADDGSIYICNLATAAGTFKVYRYTNETSIPDVIFNGDPTSGDTNAVVTNSKRFGDNMTVRGSGTNVQILVNSRGGRASALLFPVDDSLLSWTNQTILTDAANGDIGLGAAFGSGGSFWGKAPARNLRRFNIANPADIYNYNNAALVATSVVNIALSPTTTAGLAALPGSNLLAVNDYGGHLIRLYDTSSGTNVALQDTKAFPPPATANANGSGVSDFGTKDGTNYVFGVDSNNGILACRLVSVTSPVIGSGPSSTTILEGGYGNISVVANGSAPLVYYWKFNTNTVVGVFTNNGSLPLTNVSQANAGTYQVIVSNAAGTVTSTNAVLTVAPTLRTLAMSNLWTLPAGSRPYFGSSDLTRGAAANPANGHVLVVTRVGGPNIYVLDGATGAQLGQMNTDSSIVTNSAPAGFDLNMIGVADDGVVYACNLNTGGANTKVYRWDDDSASSAPVVISEADGNFGGKGRFGDSFAVRGAGTNTQILLRSQDQAFSVLLTTTDGTNFTSTVLTETADDNTRLGLAFGAGDTYWTLATTNLYQFSFDPVAGTTEILRAFSTNEHPRIGYPMGIDAQNDLLAEIGTVGQNPDNLRLFDLVPTASSNPPVTLDIEFFGSDNGNINAVGAVSFDVGRGRVYALDNNNGMIALNVIARLKSAHIGNQIVFSWTGPSVLQSSGNVTGPYVDVPSASSPYTNNIGATQFFRLRR
jgi:hypothetical protein